MYKDKDKQREANRKAQAKFKAKGITEQQGITDHNTDGDSNTLKEGYIGAVPCTPPILEPNLKRGKDIKRFADLPNTETVPTRQGQSKLPQIVITGKPGDADYNGVCTEEWRAERGR